ncbi:MAG: hypothetical protein JEZ00_10170 [Anaerolineaceae bacterium]|nr:hypothetical protein [Anaerolineaceae bacterium]
MSDCECLQDCPFFNEVMMDMPSTADRLKRKYCLGENESCARYMVFKSLGEENVPATLFPMQKVQAEKFINAA